MTQAATEEVRDQARSLREETDYALVTQVRAELLLRCCNLRGWENIYMDLAADVPFASALLDRCLEIYLAVARRTLEEVGDYVDVVLLDGDLGGTDRTLVSPATYRSLLKPRQKQIFEMCKAHTDAKLLYHSDGAVYPLIPDLIELGMDALNPVQVSAKSMGDTRQLKAEFGDKIAFWGAIDANHVLPRGSPDDVREEVRRRILDLAPGRGYVLCSVHTLQPEVPPENIVAMFDEAYELGRYPLAVQ